MRYLLVNKISKIVVNIINVDPRSINYSGPSTDEFRPYSPPEDCTLVQDDGTYSIGNIYGG
jgi:hypothetical protein